MIRPEEMRGDFDGGFVKLLGVFIFTLDIWRADRRVSVLKTLIE